MKSVEKKRQREKEMVSLMISLYCRKKHKTKNGLCPRCKELLDYSILRIDKCPFMETKTFCSNCTVHCYRKDMAQQIRQVMRYAGPRMLLHHPLMALRHVWESAREKRQQNRR